MNKVDLNDNDAKIATEEKPGSISLVIKVDNENHARKVIAALIGEEYRIMGFTFDEDEEGCDHHKVPIFMMPNSGTIPGLEHLMHSNKHSEHGMEVN